MALEALPDQVREAFRLQDRRIRDLEAALRGLVDDASGESRPVSGTTTAWYHGEPLESARTGTEPQFEADMDALALVDGGRVLPVEQNEA
ncbi:hypothetical protein AB0M39_41150 [Streptomyces sp. NPDC051907]|uniref:hypothetical protein n=1 Tax=Streptomyces sp. NPDC051907 TaxID=3155284 RepID=UPI00342FA02B